MADKKDNILDKKQAPNDLSLKNQLDNEKILPTYLTKIIDEQIQNNPITTQGNLFLNEDVSQQIQTKIGDKVAITFYSAVLNKVVMLVGYYASNYINLQQNEKYLDNITLTKRKEVLEHIYFALPLPAQDSFNKEALKHMQEDEKNLVNAKEPENKKSLRKLLDMLDHKSMNDEGYIFLSENERDELGEEFLLASRKIKLDGYLNEISIAGVKPEVEDGMEKRFNDYTLNELDKLRNLSTIIYPIFPNEKVKGAEYKRGWQTSDKKKMPLAFWMILTAITFVACICILIWVFGFVVPSSATSGIFFNQNPPVDGALVIQSLFPNAWTFLSHIAASITILCFLFFFAWRPMKEAVEKREKYIQGQISSAEKLNEEADIKLEYATRQELLSYTKSNEIIENAIHTGAMKKEELEKEAKTQAQIIIDNAHDEALRIHKQMRLDIDKEIADNSLAIAAELLKRNVQSTDNQKFVDEFIENLGN